MPYTQNWGISRNAFQSPLHNNGEENNQATDIVEENNSIASAYNDLYKSTSFGKAADAVASGDANFWQKGLNWIGNKTKAHPGIQGLNLLSGDTSQNKNLDKKLDNAQDIWTLTSAAAGATGYGEVASVPMDLMNMAFSGKRSIDHAWDKWGFGDRKDKENLKPGTHLGYAGWHGVETIPALGTIAALGRVGGKYTPKAMQYGKKILDYGGDKLPGVLQKMLFKGKQLNTAGPTHAIANIADAVHVGKSADAQTGISEKISNAFRNQPTKPTATFVGGGKLGAKMASWFLQPNKEKSEEVINPPAKKRMSIPSGNPMKIAAKYGL